MVLLSVHSLLNRVANRWRTLTRVRGDAWVQARMGRGFLKHEHGFALAFAALALTQWGGCTKFRACVDTPVCGDASAGEGGEASAGGAGGFEVGDGAAGGSDAGSGDAGSGEAGAAEIGVCILDTDCVNPDAVHCVVSCRVKARAGACVVEGADVDGDGFRSASCAAMPGDDCDDAEKRIHPGATELCDHLDNDCDGKVDLEDGLSLSGRDLALGGHADAYPQIAWATGRSLYGISFLDRTGKHWFFETIDPAGHVQLSPQIIALTPVLPDELAMTWGNDAFGVAFTLTPAGGSSLSFAKLGSDGTTSESFVVATLAADGQIPSIVRPQISRTAPGLWSVAYQAGPPVSRILDEKTFADPALVHASDEGIPIGSIAHPDAQQIAVGANLVLAFDELGKASGTVAVATTEAPAAPLSLVLSGRQPVLGAGASGFAVAVSGATASEAPQFYSFSDGGAPLCGPVKLAEPGTSPSGVAVSSRGYVVTLLGASGLSVQEVLADCTLGERFSLDSSAAISNAFVAGSATKGDAVVWTAGDSGVHFRAFGPNFCD